MYLKLCIVSMLFAFVLSDDDMKKARFLSFRPDNEDVKVRKNHPSILGVKELLPKTKTCIAGRVDLQFAIPFISIPIKKMTKSFGGSAALPTININTASLALAGVVIIGATILLPLLLKHQSSGYQRFSRVLENTEFGGEPLIAAASQIFGEGQTWSGCPQKLACWAGQKILDEDPMKIWTPILNNPLLSSFVNASSIEEAVSTGRKGSNCDIYSPCKLNEDYFSILWKNLAVLTNT